jgi:hypothetical protein
MATAPSDDGHVSTNRTGSHSIGDSMAFSRVQSGSCRWAYGLRHALSRCLIATMAPMWGGAFERRM